MINEDVVLACYEQNTVLSDCIFESENDCLTCNGQASDALIYDIYEEKKISMDIFNLMKNDM